MKNSKQRSCPDCGPEISRRGFVRTAASAAAAASLGGGMIVSARPSSDAKPEELVKKLRKSFTEEQSSVVAFDWDHPLRKKVSNNWKIVRPQIGKFYTGAQQEMIRDIVSGVLSADGWERVQKQMKDDYGGLGSYHCCVFGNPATGQYEWVLSGRHLTIRCDGDSTRGAAFGGPIFYGHAIEFNEKPDHPGNVWWHQARLANKVFGALDGKQREKALVAKSPADKMGATRVRTKGFSGIAVSDLTKDQKPLVERVMRDLLAPYRESDVEEAMKYVKKAGGLDKLHVAFYRDGDLGNDEVWDRWSIMGPAMTWYFRGSPHVHTWVTIQAPKA